MQQTNPEFAADVRYDDQVLATQASSTDDETEDEFYNQSARESVNLKECDAYFSFTSTQLPHAISHVYSSSSGDEDEEPPGNPAGSFEYLEPFDSPEFLKSERSLQAEKLPPLTPSQQAVVDLALRGHNIFLTGAAGSGKTVTLKRILQCLKEKFRFSYAVQVVAPTGIAALPLNGRTLYSFAGWKPDSFRKPMRDLLDEAKNKTTIYKAINKLSVLVIEEISMVESQFLDRLDMLVRHISEDPRPFGGKQVIFVGDFYQLPPVKPFEFCLTCGELMLRMFHSRGVYREEVCFCNSEKCPSPRPRKRYSSGDKWAFKAFVWSQLNLKHVRLEQIHRQKSFEFQSILNKVRNGILLSPEEWSRLESKKRTPSKVVAIRLMSRVEQVRKYNEDQLASLKTEAYSWTAVDSCRKLGLDGEMDWQKRDDYLQSLKKEHRFPTELTLKVGAKVVLLVNMNIGLGLVNGSQGEVVGFTKAKRSLAPAKGSLFIQDRELLSPRRPVVRFQGGTQHVIFGVGRSSLKGPSWDRYLVTRVQIPLMLGWALSIHKSQGMTLNHVEVSSKDIFEPGQLYVGLSRATSIGGLTVTGFTREQIAMDRDVLHFYKETKWESLQEKSGEDSELDKRSSESKGKGVDEDKASSSVLYIYK